MGNLELVVEFESNAPYRPIHFADFTLAKFSDNGKSVV